MAELPGMRAPAVNPPAHLSKKQRKKWRAQHGCCGASEPAQQFATAVVQQALSSGGQSGLRFGAQQCFSFGRQSDIGSGSVGDRRAKQAKAVSLQRDISAKEAEIRTEQQPPAPIFQPLPRDKDKAYPILFFLFITRGRASELGHPRRRCSALARQLAKGAAGRAAQLASGQVSLPLL